MQKQYAIAPPQGSVAGVSVPARDCIGTTPEARFGQLSRRLLQTCNASSPPLFSLTFG
jgi:hypothetical protein